VTVRQEFGQTEFLPDCHRISNYFLLSILSNGIVSPFMNGTRSTRWHCGNSKAAGSSRSPAGKMLPLGDG